MIPLLHDFTGETVLVFGGGTVGARRARRFAREADVVVVAPAFADAVESTRGVGDEAAETDGTGCGEHTGSIACVRAAPAPEDVADWVERAAPALVVAATDDPDVNEAAEAAALERSALVNRADQAGDRAVDSVVVPATVRDGPVAVSVSTSGRSPALSGVLRERIEDEIEGAGAMAELTAELRAELRAEGAPTEERRSALRAVVRDPRVWKALRTGDAKGRQEAECVIRNERGETE
ncbi:MAG: bifunctional precorrin-2 dehydrogenase/sirohydrochlorin ferrochelatase [Haloferacaceae archaeon]